MSEVIFHLSAQAVPEPPNGQPVQALEAFTAAVTRQRLKEEKPVCGGVSSADGGCCSCPPGHNISNKQVTFNHLVVLPSLFSPFAQSLMVFRRPEAEWLRAQRVCAGCNRNNPAMSAHLHQQSGSALIRAVTFLRRVMIPTPTALPSTDQCK